MLGGRAAATWGGLGAVGAGALCAVSEADVSGAGGVGSGVFTIGSGDGSDFATARGGAGGWTGAGRGAGATRGGAGAIRGGGGVGRATLSGGATGRDGLPSGAFSSGRSGAMSTRSGSPRFTYGVDWKSPGTTTNGTRTKRWKRSDVTMASASVRWVRSSGRGILHFTRSIMARPVTPRSAREEPSVRPSP